MEFAKIAEEIAKDEEGAVVALNDKNGEPYLATDGSPVTVTVTGDDAKRVQQVLDAQTRRAVRRGYGQMSPKDMRANRIEAAAAAVIDWHGWEANGQPWPCTPENVKTLLSAPHLLRQVEEAVRTHASFFTSNSTNS